MFVKNETRARAVLKRGHVTDEIAVAALVVETGYRIRDDGIETLDALPDPVPDDPPDTSLYMLWDGVSVTAAGRAYGPPKAPFVCPVSLRVGEHVRRLIVFGDRFWERRGDGQLAASAAAPFAAIELSFARAFGGGWDVPPGLLEGTDLPHPGFRRDYLWNPGGVGYYPDVARATGAPLPNIERPDQLLRNWNDAPDPAGFTPCRDLLGYRMRDEEQARAAAHAAEHGRAEPPLAIPSPRMHHHAPPDLIFPELLVGTPLELNGLGAAPLRLVVPASAVRVAVRARSAEQRIPARLRAVHINAEQRVARVIHDFSFRYDPRTAPSRLRIAPEVSA